MTRCWLFVVPLVVGLPGCLGETFIFVLAAFVVALLTLPLMLFFVIIPVAALATTARADDPRFWWSGVDR